MRPTKSCLVHFVLFFKVVLICFMFKVGHKNWCLPQTLNRRSSTTTTLSFVKMPTLFCVKLSSGHLSIVTFNVVMPTKLPVRIPPALQTWLLVLFLSRLQTLLLLRPPVLSLERLQSVSSVRLLIFYLRDFQCCHLFERPQMLWLVMP